MTLKKVRGSRDSRSTSSAARQDRRLNNREVTQNRKLTDAERLAEFRKSFYNSVLPDLPVIPGFHTCWLTTTNPRDSLAARARLGYEPIRSEEVPGWEFVTLKTGDYAGCIGVNEMIACKVPLELYEAYMYEAHHTQPLQEEQKLSVDYIENLKEQVASQAKSGDRGIEVDYEKANAELGEDRNVPSFEENLTDQTRGGMRAG